MEGRVHICGVPVDPVSSARAMIVAEKFLSDGQQHMIVTPNPEMAVLSARDQAFAKILNAADLALADGYGLKLLGRLTGTHVPEIITGTDFVVALGWLCAKTGRSMFLLGGELSDAAEKSARKLRGTFKELKIVGAESGGLIGYAGGRWDQDPMLMSRINEAQPDVLVVALGHGKQETWIRHHLKRLPSVKIAIGVGGAFNYMAGYAKRPPKLVRLARMEWLWRLLTEPSRWKRIVDAVVVFPWLVLKDRMKRVK